MKSSHSLKIVILFTILQNYFLLNPMTSKRYHYIMLFRQQSRNFPIELMEAARLDGLQEPFIFLKLYIPNMIPTFICGTVISFLNAWNSYQWPRIIMIHKEKIPMTVYLSLGKKGDTMTLVLLSMLPTLILFFALQKYFVKGMQSAMK